ncbi:MAG TPA: hypothetical protein VMY69_09610, partial [Phycisphaerae bacterium]|nr:hypothetical protein [Phycisphaerae bacterium]
VGRRKGRVLRVGSCLEIRIVRVDIPRRQLDLEPVEPAEEARAPSGPARGPKKKRRAGRGRR